MRSLRRAKPLAVPSWRRVCRPLYDAVRRLSGRTAC